MGGAIPRVPLHDEWDDRFAQTPRAYARSATRRASSTSGSGGCLHLLLPAPSPSPSALSLSTAGAWHLHDPHARHQPPPAHIANVRVPALQAGARIRDQAVAHHDLEHLVAHGGGQRVVGVRGVEAEGLRNASV